jgi:predicted ABC-type ATPase
MGISSRKTLYIIAGANGSGKTTFALNFALSQDLDFINADEIAKEYDPDDIQKYKITAGKVFFQRVNQRLSENNSFMLETTLSGKYLQKVIKKAQVAGFYISLIYLYLDNNSENILRVKNRVLAGGHNVPEIDIIRRYERSKYLFLYLYKELVDEWSLFYNGDDRFELVANNKMTIDETTYNNFLKDIKDERT